jgi:iron complex outermembrane receptor protein
LHQYFEEDISKRVSTQLKFDKQFGTEKSFTFKNSVSYFNRSIDEPLSAFAGNQLSSYTEASFNFKVGRQQFVTGLNFTTEKFKEDSIRSHHQRDYNYNTTGLFLQDDWKPTEKLAFQAGLRIDYQNQFGFFALPRLSIMYKFSNDFYMRAGSGFGYKVPSIFSTASEQAGINNILPLSSTIKAEKSIGSNLDFNYKTRIGDDGFVTLNQSFFLTQITDPLVLDGFEFVNELKPIVTSGFESNVRYTLDDFQVFAGYTFVDARRKYDIIQSFVPLTPQNKLTLDIIYEKEDNFSVAFEGYYISSMFRDLDTKTKDYFTIGFIAQKHFEHFSLIANCENLLDVRQSRFENMVLPPTATPTFRQVYAPLEGRVFNVALRLNL